MRRWHAREHRAALDGMMCLTLDERGAYNTILDLIYERSAPIPDDARWLAGWMGCSVRKWSTLRATLIVKGKLYVTQDGRLGATDYSVRNLGARLDVSAEEWQLLRAEVFKRDNYTCRYCRSFTAQPECDHVYPASKGGRSATDNLVTACKRCNTSKGAKVLSDWLAQK